jgi:predicted unusual protein kinase regulating ubiquinone biosynthesis (AarF/ABC1/UbiB family)
VKIFIPPEQLKRYRDLAWLLVKHGLGDVVHQIGLDRLLDRKGAALNRDQRRQRAAEEFAADLERLGPTFIKLGQLLSSRADLLPEAYLEALTRLQDHVQPESFEHVAKVIRADLGDEPENLLASIDPEPLAAASLGQVHKAVLPDGRDVVLKVQRPGIKQVILNDFAVLDNIADFLDQHTEFGRRYGFKRQVSELRRALMDELDFRLEADNLHRLRKDLRRFERIVVPMPIEAFCSERIVCMDYIRGQKLTSVAPELVAKAGGPELAREVFLAYLHQILAVGFFHADPHPGNIFLTEDHKIALLDLGMVARLSPGQQQELAKLLLAISEGRGEDAADIATELGEPMPGFDRPEFRREVIDFVSHLYGARVERFQAGRVVLEIRRLAGSTGIRLPNAFTMLGKTLLNLDHVGMVLDKDFDPNATIRRNAASIVSRRFMRNISPGHLFQSLLETSDLIQKLPYRLNAIFNDLVNNELRLNIDAIDEQQLLRGIHKIANRITAGLLIASLVVGAALIMPVETEHRIFGYPALAIVLFLAAAAAAIVLIIHIFVADHRSERELRRRHPQRKR